jgi:hypothetical protein
LTKRSKKPINKVLVQTFVAFLAPLALVLFRTYLWPDMPINLDGPFNAFVASLVIAGVSGVGGYMTSISPTEVLDISKSVPEARAAIEAQQP